jgi:hypothetical protein
MNRKKNAPTLDREQFAIEMAKIDAEEKAARKRKRDLIKMKQAAEATWETERKVASMNVLEEAMPDLKGMSSAQFKDFVAKAINTTFGRGVLAKILGANAPGHDKNVSLAEHGDRKSVV